MYDMAGCQVAVPSHAIYHVVKSYHCVMLSSMLSTTRLQSSR